MNVENETIRDALKDAHDTMLRFLFTNYKITADEARILEGVANAMNIAAATNNERFMEFMDKEPDDQ